MPTCKVPGCRGATSIWGTLCNTHRQRQRRHGDIHQRGLTKADLAPYVAIVRRRKARNPDNRVWSAVASRWFALVDYAEEKVAASECSEPMNRHDRRVAYEIVKLAKAVDAAMIVETGLALFVMHEMEPRRFRSDLAFRHQLVRRIRGLTETNAGTYFDQNTGTSKRVYRDLPPKVAAKLAELLVPVFGAVGVMLARKELEDAEAKRKNREELAQGLAELV